MKRWLGTAAVLGLVSTGVLAGCGDDTAGPGGTETSASSSESTSPRPTGQVGGDGALTATWSAPVTDVFTPEPGNTATNPVVAGSTVVVLTEDQATGYDLATGDQSWQTALPSFTCATSPTANADRVLGVLLTDGGSTQCDQVAALDTTTGSVLWTEDLPGGEQGTGRQVSVGDTTVVVTGACEGFTTLDVGDGREVSSEKGTGGGCPSAASDGTTVALLADGSLTTYDAGTGEQRDRWDAPADLNRLGGVLSSDPLVVAARAADSGVLLDLSGEEPALTTVEGDSFTGDPVAHASLGPTLWLQYDGADALVGYDLDRGEDDASLPLTGGQLLVGTRDDRLALTGGATGGVELQLVDPASQDGPESAGLLPTPAGAGDGALATTLTDDAIVRLWPTQVDVYPLS